jgi:exodeoxyribonuclease VII small subunit
MTKQVQDYKSMMKELQLLINDIQTKDLDVDEVISKYQRGQKLIDRLKKYLETAENKIIKHKLPKKGETD